MGAKLRRQRCSELGSSFSVALGDLLVVYVVIFRPWCVDNGDDDEGNDDGVCYVA
jgi:hypothetical protein